MARSPEVLVIPETFNLPSTDTTSLEDVNLSSGELIVVILLLSAAILISLISVNVLISNFSPPIVEIPEVAFTELTLAPISTIVSSSPCFCLT